MNYTEFLCSIKQSMTEVFDSSFNICVKPIEKNNGTYLDGLIICNPDYNISPTIYLNPYYHRYLEGVSIKDICDDIFTTYNQYMPATNFDIESVIDFEKCKDSIIYKLINYKKNEGMLSHIPHLKYLDFAVIFQISLNNTNFGNASITIHEQLVERWGATLTDLQHLAAQNTPRLFPHQLIDLNKLVSKVFDMSAYGDVTDMYALSNITKTNGASVILYEGLLNDIANKLNSNLILLPSSIHEFIIMPHEYDTDLAYLTELINSVNDTSVSDEEILSNHPYIYDKITKCLMIPD